MMVTFKVDAEAKIQGTDDQEKKPIVAKVKGTGKDGSLNIQVSGEGSTPLFTKISGDDQAPIAIAPLTLTPISVVPDLKEAAETLNIKSIISALEKISKGLKIEVSNSRVEPISLALTRIPVDLTISVYSPTQETVFKVDIKGSIGEN